MMCSIKPLHVLHDIHFPPYISAVALPKKFLKLSPVSLEEEKTIPRFSFMVFQQLG